VTIQEALDGGAAALAVAGVPDADLDAELLLRHVLRLDRAALFAAGPAPIPADVEARFRALTEARAGRRPLRHLTGTQHFWRHEFRVGPDVLIPRPETELVVEAGLQALEGTRQPAAADIGTGSGCIALSLAAERGDATVEAVDASAAALSVAGENARALGLLDRVRFHLGDLLEPLAALHGRLDLVASNPPYVDASEWPGLAPEVRDNEPRLALVPPDGDRYGVYRRLAPQAARALRPGGTLVLEIGRGMDREVGEIAAAAGLRVDRVLRDLQQIDRVVVCRRPA
jgi:release factor glutamine methyltransferase